MTHLVITCQSSDRIDAVLAIMTVNKIRHVPVVDNGKLNGIVSIGDLVKHRMDEKELEAGVLLEIARRRA
jgi:CBS domain-containing protein